MLPRFLRKLGEAVLVVPAHQDGPPRRDCTQPNVPGQLELPGYADDSNSDILCITLRKTIMETEKGLFMDYCPFYRVLFQVPCSFSRAY